MTDYSNQDISGQNFTSANLTGANFTNTNATNVNFTNAIITNATFRNTLITGANLTGITFSNLQKGQLLLRAANLTITAVNNLTSLTIQELRIIQPAISLRSLNQIQTVAVSVPNNAGQGYFAFVTPNINEAICIFVATNQNVFLINGGIIIRTIRNTGTVIQDVDTASTISYTRVGSISYRLSVGNADGVIVMIPMDMNVVRVNDVGINDIISLNTTSITSSTGYSWDYIINNNSTRISKVNFTNLNINLLTERVRCVIHIKLGSGDFVFPLIFFNNNHNYPSSTSNMNEFSRTVNIVHSSTWSNQHLYNVAQSITNQFTMYQDGSMTFANVSFPNSASFMTLKFDIDLQKTKGNICSELISQGEWTWTSKNSSTNFPNYIYHGYFNRISILRPISSYLVASFNFDSNLIDYSPNGNTLTNISNVTFNTTDFKQGTASASFGGNNYFEIANNGRFSPDNLTIMTWIKPVTSSGQFQSIASCRNIGNYSGWMIYINQTTNDLEFYALTPSTFNGGLLYSNFAGVFANTWVHLGITLNKASSTCILYINGNIFRTITAAYSNNTGTNLRIGAGSNEGAATFFLRSGTLIDNFNIYNKVLIDSEILNVYSTTQTIPTTITTMVASYNFNSSPNDTSVNNNTLTNINSVTYNTSDYIRGTASASFNGSNYFEITNDGRFSPDNLTVAFWIKPVVSVTVNQTIVTCRDGTVGTNLRGWIVFIDPSNNLQFWTGGGGSTWSGTTEVVINGFGVSNIWTHVAITLNKSTGATIVYLNGRLHTSLTRTYVNNTGRVLRIGAGGDVTADTFVRNGTLIDHLNIYNSILSSNDISNVFSGSEVSQFGISDGKQLFTLRDIGICSNVNTNPTIEHVTMNLEEIALPSF